MSRQFWSFLAVGLVIVAAAVAVVWTGTQGAHLELTGKIINVRSMAMGDGTALVLVDFRVTNPSDINVVVREVSLRIERDNEEPLKGLEVSRNDVDTMFRVHPLLGGKSNDVLAPSDQIPGRKTFYRMAEASFEITPAALKSRKNLVVHIEDVDGAGFDIAENGSEDKK